MGILFTTGATAQGNVTPSSKNFKATDKSWDKQSEQVLPQEKQYVIVPLKENRDGRYAC